MRERETRFFLWIFDMDIWRKESTSREKHTTQKKCWISQPDEEQTHQMFKYNGTFMLQFHCYFDSFKYSCHIHIHEEFSFFSLILKRFLLVVKEIFSVFFSLLDAFIIVIFMSKRFLQCVSLLSEKRLHSFLNSKFSKHFQASTKATEKKVH